MTETVVLAEDTHFTMPGRRWIKNLRVGFAVLLTAVGLSLVLTAHQFGYVDRMGTPGPGFFPFWVGCAMTILAACWGVAEYREPIDAQVEQDLDSVGWKRTASFVIAMVLFMILLLPVGYVLTSMAFMLYLTFTSGQQRGKAWLNIVVSLGASLGAFLFFEHFLGVPLPNSFIPFLADLGL